MVGIALLLGSSCQDIFVRGCFPSTLGVWDRWFLMTTASLMKRFRGCVCSPPSQWVLYHPSSIYFSVFCEQHVVNGTQWGSFILHQGWGYNPPWQGSHGSRECEVADHTAPIVRILGEVKAGMSLTFPFASSRRAAHKTSAGCSHSGRVYPLQWNLSGNSLTNTSRDVSPRWL